MNICVIKKKTQQLYALQSALYWCIAAAPEEQCQDHQLPGGDAAAVTFT